MILWTRLLGRFIPLKKLTTRGKIFFSLLALVLLIIGFILPSFFKADAPDTEKTETPEEPDSTEIEQVEIAESNYPGLHLEIQTADTDNYHYAVHSLTTDSETLTVTIQNWLTNEKDTFLKEADEYATAERPAHLNIALNTIPITKSTYNLVFNTYEITGGANGISKTKPFVVNIEEEKHYTLTDFLELNEETQDHFTEIIKQMISEDENLQQEINEDKLIQSLSDINQLKWTITDEILTLYWDKYAIAAGASGLIILEIPLENIADLLTEEAQEMLHFEVAEEPTEPEAPDEMEDISEDTESEVLPSDGKYVAVTFDDGPHPNVTGQILQTLKEFNAKATFFMLGNQVDYYPNIVQQIATEGHEIGNHSQTHADLTTISPEQLQNEFSYTNERIKEITGRYPTLFRPPYGAYNDGVIAQATNVGLPIIMWSVDSLDWQSRDPIAINEVIMTETAPGSIILSHDIHETTAQALPTVLSNLQNEGYTFVTVSQLLEWRGDAGIGPHFGSYQ